MTDQQQRQQRRYCPECGVLLPGDRYRCEERPCRGRGAHSGRDVNADALLFWTAVRAAMLDTPGMGLDSLRGERYVGFCGVDNEVFVLEVGGALWAFEAVEDSCDNYRSCLKEVRPVALEHGAIIHFAMPVARVVVARIDEEDWEGYHLIDEQGRVWLRVGTNSEDNYYPQFVFDYTPPQRPVTEAPQQYPSAPYGAVTAAILERAVAFDKRIADLPAFDVFSAFRAAADMAIEDMWPAQEEREKAAAAAAAAVGPGGAGRTIVMISPKIVFGQSATYSEGLSDKGALPPLCSLVAAQPSPWETTTCWFLDGLLVPLKLPASDGSFDNGVCSPLFGCARLPVRIRCNALGEVSGFGSLAGQIHFDPDSFKTPEGEERSRFLALSLQDRDGFLSLLPAEERLHVVGAYWNQATGSWEYIDPTPPMGGPEQAAHVAAAPAEERAGRVRLRKANIVGSTTSPAFVDWFDYETGQMRGELRILERPVYEEGSGDFFRTARLAAELSLRQGAERLGISLVEMSSLERGEMVPEDADELVRTLLLLKCGPK